MVIPVPGVSFFTQAIETRLFRFVIKKLLGEYLGWFIWRFYNALAFDLDPSQLDVALRDGIVSLSNVDLIPEVCTHASHGYYIS